MPIVWHLTLRFHLPIQTQYVLILLLTFHHKWIVSFDYASLYPSIIRLLKISPESLIKGQDANRFDTLNKILNHEYNTEDIKAKNYAVAANGAVFDQSIEGVLPETMKYLMEERNSVKSTMKDKDRHLK